MFNQEVDTWYIATGFEGNFDLGARKLYWDLNYANSQNKAEQTNYGSYNIRRIAQAQNRLAQIAGELSDCQSDPMHELFERKRLAATQDRDYLAELATVLDEKIRASNDRLNELRRKAGTQR